MSNGFYDEYTASQLDMSFYCHICGHQVPTGFRHHHASDIPKFLKRIKELEKQLVDAVKKQEKVSYDHPKSTFHPQEL